MPQFIITYIGGNKPATPEEGKKQMSEYRNWLISLGDSAVSPANPFKDTNTVKSDRTVTAGSGTLMSGFTVIETDSIDTAISAAKKCPFLDTGGTLEVSELMKMPEQP